MICYLICAIKLIIDKKGLICIIDARFCVEPQCSKSVEKSTLRERFRKEFDSIVSQLRSNYNYTINEENQVTRRVDSLNIWCSSKIRRFDVLGNWYKNYIMLNRSIYGIEVTCYAQKLRIEEPETKKRNQSIALKDWMGTWSYLIECV